MNTLILMYFVINALIAWGFLNSPTLMMDMFDIDVAAKDEDTVSDLLMFIFFIFFCASIIIVVSLIAGILTKLLIRLFYRKLHVEK